MSKSETYFDLLRANIKLETRNEIQEIENDFLTIRNLKVKYVVDNYKKEINKINLIESKIKSKYEKAVNSEKLVEVVYKKFYDNLTDIVGSYVVDNRKYYCPSKTIAFTKAGPLNETIYYNNGKKFYKNFVFGPDYIDEDKMIFVSDNIVNIFSFLEKDSYIPIPKNTESQFYYYQDDKIKNYNYDFSDIFNYFPKTLDSMNFSEIYVDIIPKNIKFRNGIMYDGKSFLNLSTKKCVILEDCDNAEVFPIYYSGYNSSDKFIINNDGKISKIF